MSKSSSVASRGSPLGNPDDRQSTARAVRAMFAAVARRYDLLNHFLSLGRDIAWRKATARALRHALARPGSLAVDVCCGTGDLALALAHHSEGRVLGTDFCRPMLQRAREKGKQRAGKLFFLEADTLTLPFRNDSLDVVSVAFGFRNLANYQEGLGEMHRVLRRGGTLAILEFSTVRWPVFGPLFRFYFHHILPRLGTWISGVSGPYQYLPDSVSRFPSQEELATAMRGVGFREVTYRNFTAGVAALHLGVKA
ncbi:MAG: bifunctional demethylmenaquinone methyltransferase/2-methoxy-6-polyprenyl-1,4-benzoquinol methylase UbiE [Acidobacteriia bacterium]|nr:bifunctional demethylmenaquinone methyltransferase/2-methoxy-6-polyprenyl-1,4-benzoquinol methylase UbiE [Terriglobia bacterium]